MSELAVIEYAVRLRNRRAIAVRAPFSPSFGDALKAMIPREDREFRFPTSSWVIAGKHRYQVEKLVLKFFGEYLVIGGKDDGLIYNKDGAALKQESLALL